MMKHSFVILLLMLDFSTVFSQDESLAAGELYFDNLTPYYAIFKIYPISTTYNGFYNCTLESRWQRKEFETPQPDLYYYYLNGTNVNRLSAPQTLNFEHSVGPYIEIAFNHDRSGDMGSCIGSIGWGKYKMIVSIPPFSNEDFPEGFLDSCIIEWDWTNNNDVVQDTYLILKMVNGAPQLFYKRKPWQNVLEKPITFVDKYIKQWQPYGSDFIDNPSPDPDYIPLPKYFGNFTYSGSSPYSIFPLDSRRDCDLTFSPNPTVNIQNQNYSNSDNRNGVVTLNLTIDKNVNTSTDYKNNIVIENGAQLKLNPAKTLNLLKLSASNTGTDLTVNPFGKLELAPGTNSSQLTELHVKNFCTLWVERSSYLTLGSNSKIVIENQGTYKNCGATLNFGSNSFIRGLKGSRLVLNPLQCMATSYPSYQDNITINGGTLDLDGATLEIGDSCNLVLDGDTSSVRLASNTNIIFGKNAKIILRNGANLIADSCTFTSDTNTSLAGGIVLENAGNNSKITNCTFSNCKTAITVKDSGGVYNSCEISNNTFNIPAGGNYGIYAKDVDNVVIKGNKFNLADSKSNVVGLYYKNIAQTDSTILHIPDSTSITFKSKAASLSLLSRYSEIKMGAGSTLTFDSAASFNAQNIKFTSLDTTKPWGGLFFKNMDTVVMQGSEVKNVNANSINSGYGINLVNTKVINIDGCNIFNTNSSAGGIQVYYISNLYMDPEINITGNTIKIHTDTLDGVRITPYGWLTLTGYIYDNKIINTSSGGGRYGIYGFDLVGTPVKNNYVENFAHGILTWYSSLDLFENTVDTKDIWNGYGLNGIFSEYNLGTAYEDRLGGSNVITTGNGQCIHLDGLDLNISGGNNIFRIEDSLAYHLAGYYPTGDLGKVPASGNCFKIGVNSIGLPNIRANVKWSDGVTNVDFEFTPFNCSPAANYCNYYLGGNPSDTVWIECADGMGGGARSSRLSDNSSQVSASEENIYKQLYDSLSINMRKKQYELAAQKCMTLLDNYTDSAKTINAVDKLYRTALVGNKMNELKSYYESLIQNHPENTELVQRIFYYLQKAKARLGQYQSAMTGFQTIMTQFPASFEGLAAKWDYMATELLYNGGNGGGEKDITEKEVTIEKKLTKKQMHEKLVSLVEDPLDKYDKKKFTKNDRKVIVNNIVNAFETQKNKDTKKLKELETKVLKSSATVIEKKEYKTKRALQEVVRLQRARTINEHINTVQSDILKVFPAAEKSGNTESVNAIIPMEYKLNQNYPNPFNPVTNIRYSIPKSGFVSIKIYDVTGRMVKELVNEMKETGSYSVVFEGSAFASGVYFYRIESNSFTDTKRMVLVK